MKNNTKDSKQMLFEMMHKVNPEFHYLNEQDNEPNNIKYAPAKCKTIDDIKRGLEDLHSKFPNKKTNILVGVKIKAYDVVAKNLGLEFNAEKYFDSL